MSARKISQHFDGIGKVPVDIQDVLNWINAHLPDDVIRIHGIDVSPDMLRGGIVSTHKHVEPLPGSAIKPWREHLIAYSTQLTPEMQRLVVCKEILHVFEPATVQTNDSEKVLALAQALLPEEGAEPGIGAAAALADNISKWNALTVLFPYGYWEVCAKAFNEGTMTLAEISDSLELPSSYVAVTLKGNWPKLREIFLGL